MLATDACEVHTATMNAVHARISDWAPTIRQTAVGRRAQQRVPFRISDNGDGPRLENEAALARLWADSPRMCDVLECADGSRYKIAHPGVQNSAAGPDFRGAVLMDQDGRRMTGDVELHLAARDWYSHGHHLDANYNGVVLHVVVNRTAHETSRQASRMNAPVAVLSTTSNPDNPTEPAAKGVFDGWDRDRIGEQLDVLGDRRFLDRSRGFRMQLDAGADADQTVYESLMEAMGYTSNTKPFRQLAGAVPYSTLRRLAGEPAGALAAGVTALLADAGGLIEHIAPPAHRSQLVRLARKLGRPKRTALPQWKLFRVRPVNHPAQRLQGAAGLLARTVRTGLSATLVGYLAADSPDRLAKNLQEPPFIGAGRASEIAINVALPFLHALGCAGGDASLRETSMAGYRCAAAATSYGSSTRFAKGMGIPTDRGFLATARRQQGLLHLNKHLPNLLDSRGQFRVQPDAASISTE
ncbi:MAG: hypothetical protein CL694_15825 [Chloroflexi bacterium]|nr:hypothetical protein [Chloroflexota bacterium]